MQIDGWGNCLLLPCHPACAPPSWILGRFWLDNNRENFRDVPLVSGQVSQVSLHPVVGRKLAESPAFSELQAVFLLLPPVSHGTNLDIYVLGWLAGQ